MTLRPLYHTCEGKSLCKYTNLSGNSQLFSLFFGFQNRKVGVAQVGFVQVSSAQVGVVQVSSAQVGVAQVGFVQVSSAQVGVAQVGSAQVASATVFLIVLFSDKYSKSILPVHQFFISILICLLMVVDG